MIEPSSSLRSFLRALQRRRADDAPWAPLRSPLAECRVALVVSSVCLVRGDPRDYPGVEVGDPALREIDDDVEAVELLASACGRAEDGAADLGCTVARALDGLRGAVTAGRLGALNRRHLAVCGPLAATAAAIRRAAPRAADLLTADQVDVALLVPT